MRISTVKELKEFLESINDEVFVSINLKDDKYLFLSADDTIELEYDQEGKYLYITGEMGSVINKG